MTASREDAPVATGHIRAMEPKSDPAVIDDPPPTCPNCSSKIVGSFCPSCGQRVDSDPRSVRYWVHLVLDEVLSLDGRIPRTLKALFFRPGLLTQEWANGRRSRWSKPFRLYILASLFFFTLALLSPVQWETTQVGGQGASAHQAMIDAGQETTQRVASQLVIVLVPLFALLLWLVFDRRSYYVKHLVHALHLHAFSFFVLSTWYLIGLLPDLLPLVILPFLLWIPVYLVLSCRRVYGRGLVGSVLRSAVVLVAYVFVLWAAFDAVEQVGQRDPRDAVERMHERYWEVREAFEAGDLVDAGYFLIVEYERLEEYLHTPHVRADLADLLLWVGRSEEARRRAEEALLTDPDHLLALGVAARAADADSLPEVASGYRARFLAAYPSRYEDEEFRNRHRSDLEDFRREAEGSDTEQVFPQGAASSGRR